MGLRHALHAVVATALLTGAAVASPASASATSAASAAVAPSTAATVRPAALQECFRQVKLIADGKAARTGPGLSFPVRFIMHTGDIYDVAAGPATKVSADGFNWQPGWIGHPDTSVWYPVSTTVDHDVLLAIVQCLSDM